MSTELRDTFTGRIQPSEPIRGSQGCTCSCTCHVFVKVTCGDQSQCSLAPRGFSLTEITNLSQPIDFCPLIVKVKDTRD